MADIPTSQFTHYTSEIDAAVNEVIAARGGSGTLSAALAAKVETSTYATDKAALDAEIAVVANSGAKNLLPMTHSSGSITRYGVTCTWNTDEETMTLNGTHSSGDSSAIFEFYDGSAEATKMLPAGSYVLTGCPAGGSTSTYRAILTQIAGAVDVGNGINFELSEPHYAAYRILISGNVTFNNMVFRPMIRSAAIIDPTHEPYAPSNRELHKNKADISQVFGRGIALKATDDCDNITDVGMHYALSSATVPAANAPFSTSGFRLRVENWYQSQSGVVGIIQIADKYSSSEYVEKRRIYFYTSNIGWRWTDWTTTINVSMTVPADRSLQSESLTKGATEMSGAEQDEPKSREEER